MKPFNQQNIAELEISFIVHIEPIARLESHVNRLEERNKDLEKQNSLLKEQLLNEQTGVNKELKNLQEQVSKLANSIFY
jgi:predicted  nucleic acid-binding Zn-ribbon protein